MSDEKIIRIMTMTTISKKNLEKEKSPIKITKKFDEGIVHSVVDGVAIVRGLSNVCLGELVYFMERNGTSKKKFRNGV